MTGNHYYYKVQWMGKWRYGAGILPALLFVSVLSAAIRVVCNYFLVFLLLLFLYLFQTLVASVLLRQIHYHIFKFFSKCIILFFFTRCIVQCIIIVCSSF